MTTSNALNEWESSREYEWKGMKILHVNWQFLWMVRMCVRACEWMGVCVCVYVSRCLNVFILLLLQRGIDVFVAVAVVVAVVVVAIITVTEWIGVCVCMTLCACTSIRVCSCSSSFAKFPSHTFEIWNCWLPLLFISLLLFVFCENYQTQYVLLCMCLKYGIAHAHTRIFQFIFECVLYVPEKTKRNRAHTFKINPSM